MALELSYQCDSKTSCYPIEFTFIPGIYKVELWGAQGGNISGEAEGGHGGYASAIIPFRKTQKMYLFLGAGGVETTTSGFTQNAYNGGGKGAYNLPNYRAASGGGATDLRTNLSLYSRILVAGGGSGATSYSNSLIVNNGSCGGGINGGDGIDSLFNNGLYKKGEGGKQDKGGESVQQNGSFGYGGNQTYSMNYGSGGGGGWFGGGSGLAYGATGGGGSGYVSPFFKQSQLISGCSLIPNFYCLHCKVTGHIGDGAARITLLNRNTFLQITIKTLSFFPYLLIILK